MWLNIGSILKSMGVVLILVIFHGRSICSAIPFERSRRELSIDVTEHRSILKSKGEVSWLFFKVGPCSAISFGRSRRELSIDVARSILKNRSIRSTTPFSFKSGRTPLNA